MKKVLKERFDIDSKWESPKSDCIVFGSGMKSAAIDKSNNIRPEIVEWVMVQLDISMADFEAAYRTMELKRR